MIMDAGSLPVEAPQADLIIVGAGVHGCALAASMDGQGVRVVLLEAGGAGGEDEHVVSDVGDTPFEGATRGRRSGYGGSGTWWAGQCSPFDPLDFETRDWVPHSGWPLGAEDMKRWYHAAAKLLFIENEPFGEQQWTRRRVAPVEASGLHHKFSVFSPRPDVGRTVAAALRRSSNVTVVLNAPVTAVQRMPTSRSVSGVTVHVDGGASRLLRAPVVVLSGGGIEVPRLLLASREHDAAGLGNGHDLVGRFLHDHPNGVAASVVPWRARHLQDAYAMMYSSRTRAWARMQLDQDAQRDVGVVSAIANVVFDYEGAGPVDALKTVVRRRKPYSSAEGRLPPRWRAAADGLRALPAVPSVAWRRYGRGLSPSQPARRILLQTASEQPPRPASRVTLSATRDARGVPLARVEWYVGEEERQAQRALVDAVGRAWRSAGLADVIPMEWLSSRDDWRRHQVDAYHHSGTVRMAATPSTGVVDADLQCHQVSGLYVAGTAVLPTSSSSNPTFTSLALTLRLADHLKRTRWT